MRAHSTLKWRPGIIHVSEVPQKAYKIKGFHEQPNLNSTTEDHRKGLEGTSPNGPSLQGSKEILYSEGFSEISKFPNIFRSPLNLRIDTATGRLFSLSSKSFKTPLALQGNGTQEAFSSDVTIRGALIPVSTRPL